MKKRKISTEKILLFLLVLLAILGPVLSSYTYDGQDVTARNLGNVLDSLVWNRQIRKRLIYKSVLWNTTQSADWCDFGNDLWRDRNSDRRSGRLYRWEDGSGAVRTDEHFKCSSVASLYHPDSVSISSGNGECDFRILCSRLGGSGKALSGRDDATERDGILYGGKNDGCFLFPDNWKIYFAKCQTVIESADAVAGSQSDIYGSFSELSRNWNCGTKAALDPDDAKAQIVISAADDISGCDSILPFLTGDYYKREL